MDMLRIDQSTLPALTLRDASCPSDIEAANDEYRARLLPLYRAADIGQFWIELRALLHEVMQCDALVVYLNFLDYATSWRAAKVIASPNARQPMPWLQSRRGIDTIPDFISAQASQLKVYRLSDVVPDPTELCRTPFFRSYLAAGGWHYLAGLLYWRGSRVCSQITLRRKREQGDFTHQELALLASLHPHIEAVLDRLLSVDEERARCRGLEDFSEHLPFALLSLNWDLHAVFANKKAFEHCAAWNYCSGDARRYRARSVFDVPAPIITACETLKAQWVEQAPRQECPAQQFTRVIEHPLDEDLLATVRLQSDSRSGVSNPHLLVYFQTRPPATDRSEAPAQSLLDRLTQAERELVRYVCRGLGNQEIAAKLNKSVRTVKGQLTSVYRKVGVVSRSRLLADFAHLVR